MLSKYSIMFKFNPKKIGIGSICRPNPIVDVYSNWQLKNNNKNNQINSIEYF